MNKIRNHTIGATITTVALVAVALTGCGTENDEDCREDNASSMSLVVGKGSGSGGSKGGSKGGSGRGGGKVSKPGKAKAPKVHIDDEDCN